MGKNTWVLVVIAILVVIAVIYFLTMNSQNPSSAVSQNNQNVAGNNSTNTSSDQNITQSVPQTYTVVYDGSGFSPNVVTIKAGDTVVFQNNSSVSVRVASNPHPVHTDYPGFDSLQPFSLGQSYSFTFTRIGSWGYHNHLMPSQGGTVVVQ